MNFLQEMKKIISASKEIALATCVDNIPNVRIVNFCESIEKNGILYFSTFGDNQKVEEFAKNNTVAFTTIPHHGNEHVRVKNAKVQKSALTVFDLKEEFIKKTPDYAMTLEQVGSSLVLFEIHFNQADVIIDFTQSGTVTL